MSIHSEYIKIQNDAITALRESIDFYEIQILSLETFGYPTAYYICRDEFQNNEYVFYVIQWNKYFDLEITQNPLTRLKFIGKALKPTITQKKINNPDKEKIENLLISFLDLNLSRDVKKNDFGIDGTTFEVSMFKQPFKKELRYVWRCDAPEEWKELEELMRETIQLFRDESKLKGWIYK